MSGWSWPSTFSTIARALVERPRPCTVARLLRLNAVSEWSEPSTFSTIASARLVERPRARKVTLGLKQAETPEASGRNF